MQSIQTHAKRENAPLFYLLLGYAVYGAVYICRYNLTVAGVHLESAGILSTAQYGLVGSAFSIAYAIGRVINGALGDRMRPGLMLGGGMALAGIANLTIGLYPRTTVIIACWALNAWAQSMIWGPLLHAVTRRFAKEKRDYAASLLASAISTGSMLGILIASLAISARGIAWAFLLPGGIGLLLSCAALFYFREGRPAASLRQKERAPLLSRLRRMMPVLLPAFFHGCMKDNVSYWAASYFRNSYQIEIQALTGFIFMVPVVGLIGRLLYPLILRFCGKREHTVSVIGFGVCACAGIGLCLFQSPLLSAACLCLVAAAISLINTSLVSIYPLRFVADGSVSSVSGILDFVTYTGSAVSALIYGQILSASGMCFSWMFGSWILISLLSIGILAKIMRKE